VFVRVCVHVCDLVLGFVPERPERVRTLCCMAHLFQVLLTDAGHLQRPAPRVRAFRNTKSSKPSAALSTTDAGRSQREGTVAWSPTADLPRTIPGMCVAAADDDEALAQHHVRVDDINFLLTAWRVTTAEHTTQGGTQGGGASVAVLVRRRCWLMQRAVHAAWVDDVACTTRPFLFVLLFVVVRSLTNRRAPNLGILSASFLLVSCSRLHC